MVYAEIDVPALVVQIPHGEAGYVAAEMLQDNLHGVRVALCRCHNDRIGNKGIDAHRELHRHKAREVTFSDLPLDEARQLHLERESGLRCGVDFKVGYSPERINPGDKVHTLTTIRKIVSGMDDESLEEIKRVYDIVIEAGTYPVSSIKTAEAIKVVENSQRDINIAFMNELAMVFDRMGIDTSEVVEGMNTKWNALGFKPGLVGGHCIGVDPYYFTYEAEKLGYHSQIILSGRRVNDAMGGFVAETAIREMVRVGLAPKSSNVVVLGITFKENCPDVRNSKVYDIVMRLKEYGVEPSVVDPWASGDEVKQVYGMQLRESGDIANADCLIVAVAHDEFKELGFERIDAFFGDKPDESKVLLDVKGILDAKRFSSYGSFWRL